MTGLTDLLIIGKGNSAFETADNLVERAAVIHVAGPRSIRFAWRTHFIGHLRANDVSAADARAIFAQVGICAPVISVSCHTAQEVSLGEGHGADFAVYGPVFGKEGDEAAAAGLAGLEAVCRKRRTAQAAMPVLALGGVTVSNAADCLKAGAGGIAGIRLFQNGNLAETVSRLRKLADELHC